jgi:hypothetical protein
VRGYKAELNRPRFPDRVVEQGVAPRVRSGWRVDHFRTRLAVVTVVLGHLDALRLTMRAPHSIHSSAWGCEWCYPCDKGASRYWTANV